MTESDKPQIQSRPPSCEFIGTMEWAGRRVWGGRRWTVGMARERRTCASPSAFLDVLVEYFLYFRLDMRQRFFRPGLASHEDRRN